MTFFAAGLSPTSNFKITPNHWDRDPRMSLKAKGLLGYLATHSDGYKCTITQMVAETKEGQDAIYGALAELKRLRYLVFDHERDKLGRPVRGGSRYRWGPAAYVQEYERNWSGDGDQSGQAEAASGKSGTGQDNTDDHASSQVDPASGISRSGEARSGKPGSGEPGTKKYQSSKKDQEPKKDHPDQPSVDQPGSGSDTVQPALDGTIPTQPTPASAEQGARDVAFGVARAWLTYRAEQGTPVVVGTRSGPIHAVVKLIYPFVVHGYTEVEVKKALNIINVGLPSAQQMDRTLAAIRNPALRTAGDGRGRPAVTLDVNAAWDAPAGQPVAAGGGW